MDVHTKRGGRTAATLALLVALLLHGTVVATAATPSPTTATTTAGPSDGPTGEHDDGEMGAVPDPTTAPTTTPSVGVPQASVTEPTTGTPSPDPSTPAPTGPPPTTPPPSGPAPTGPPPTDPVAPPVTPSPTGTTTAPSTGAPAGPGPAAAAPAVPAEPHPEQPGHAHAGRQPLTPDELAAQQEEARRYVEGLDPAERAAHEARQGLAEASAAAGQALEAHQQARQEHEGAAAAAQQAREQWEDARALAQGRRGEMGRWAASTYRDGGVLGGYDRMVSVLTAPSTDDLAQRLAMLQRVGRMRGSLAQEADRADSLVAQASRAASAAAARAALALEHTATTATQADEQVAEHARRVAVLEGTATTIGPGSASPLGEVGACTGLDVSRFTNGAIPAAALCPLPGAPGHRLRADAAHAFGWLSAAYAARFGTPVCVTDSYRSLPAQVSVRERKPHLAAVPGTSRHGWAVAVDLCDGVERFGTPQHQWMRIHAPLHGFFHPRWAQEGGSRPEPWHWEYAGHTVTP